MSTPPQQEAPRKPRRRRWLRRALFAAAGLLALLILFHRPLLRWGIDAGARHFAEKAGYTLAWELDGSVLSDFSIGKFTFTGPEGSLLRRIEWSGAGARYNLWRFRQQGLGALLDEISLADATLEIDARAAPAKKTPAKPAKPGPPPDIWIGRVDLQNINATVLTDAGTIVVKGFTLLLDPDQPGALRIEELVVPSAKLHLRDVQARTEVVGRRIRLVDLQLMPEVRAPELAVDLGELKDGAIFATLDLISGEARAKLNAQASGIGTALDLDASLSVQNLAHTDVARWVALPEGLEWRPASLRATVRGVSASPHAFQAGLELNAPTILWRDLPAMTLATNASLGENGAFQISRFRATMRDASVELTASGSLPAAWSEIAHTQAQAVWTASIPDLEPWSQPAFPLAGQAEIKGEARLRGQKLDGLTSSWQGRQLRLGPARVPLLEAQIDGADTSVEIKSLTAQWDAQNQARLQGTLDWAGAQPVSASLALNFADIGVASRDIEMTAQWRPDAGVLTGQATTQFTLKDLAARQWNGMTADAALELAGVECQKNRIERAALAATFREGTIHLPSAQVALNDQNKVSLSGSLGLQEDQPFSAEAEIDLKRLTDLNGWLALAQASKTPPAIVAQTPPGADPPPLTELPEPGTADATLKTEATAPPADTPNQTTEPPARPPLRLDSGSAHVAWKGAGTLRDGDIQGAGTARVSDLRLSGQPNAYALELETRHEGRRAEISKLEASAGRLRASLQAAVSETDLSIPSLRLSSGTLALVEGRAEIPLALAADPRPSVPLDIHRPAEVELRARRLDMAALFRELGQPAPVEGAASMDLKISGPLGAPEAALSLALDNVKARAAGEKLARSNARLQATLSNNQLRASARAHQPPWQPLTLEAEMPCEVAKWIEAPDTITDGPVRARAQWAAADLTPLRSFVPAISAIRGKASLDAEVGGTLKNPSWKGAVTADIAALDIEEADMPVRDGTLRLSLEGRQVTLRELSATAAGGTVMARGTADFSQLSNPTFDLSLDAKEALLMRDETLSQRADVRLTCQGALAKAHVAGEVRLVRGRVFKEIEYLPLSLPNSLPPPPPPVKRSTAKPSAPPPFDQWTVDVAVRTKDPIRLLGNVLNGGVTVHLDARGTGGQPEIEGKVSLQDARLQLPFSRIAITRGDVIFTKDRPLDPQLDLMGDSFVNNTQVTLYAYGPALAPKTRFTSSPPMSEGEIATLLATGTTADDLRSSEGVAANRAAFLLISQTYRKLFKKNAVQRYDETPPKFSFSFNPLSTGSSQRGVTGTYEISPKVQFTGTVQENGGFRGLLYYMIRFR